MKRECFETSKCELKIGSSERESVSDKNAPYAARSSKQVA